ncbi:MAG TPA: bifunctional glutamate N-acetyltransferase/amino-acid acetyltransferase ArgJ [Dehalococcoidia bacterium]
MTESSITGVLRVIPDGSVTTPEGFYAGAVYAGVKTYGDDKLDLGILYSDRPCHVAAVFTRNEVKGACVLVTMEHVADGRAQALVVNAGCANVCTGEQGLEDAREMARLAALRTGAAARDVLVCSTGVIGVPLPMDRIREGIARITLDPDGGRALARAIMTTDTRPKHIAMQFQHEGRTYAVGGIAKGSGMIHPDMATMFCFLTTDAPVAPAFLDATLRSVADRTFNMVSVDGDTSTSDTMAVLANGAAGGDPIDAGHGAAQLFQEALYGVSLHLAREIARDGEGASRLIEVRVYGAATKEEARRAARAVTVSPLVKTAVYGRDPNWGRVMMAVGRSGARVDVSRAVVRLGDVAVFVRGRPVPFDEEEVRAILGAPEVRIEVNLGVGSEGATAWGCDLTEAYVRINSEYTT